MGCVHAARLRRRSSVRDRRFRRPSPHRLSTEDIARRAVLRGWQDWNRRTRIPDGGVPRQPRRPWLSPIVGAVLGGVLGVVVSVADEQIGNPSLLKVTLAVLVGTLTFSFAVLQRIDDDVVPDIGVTAVGSLDLLVPAGLHRLLRSIHPSAATGRRRRGCRKRGSLDVRQDVALRRSARHPVGIYGLDRSTAARPHNERRLHAGRRVLPSCIPVES